MIEKEEFIPRNTLEQYFINQENSNRILVEENNEYIKQMKKKQQTQRIKRLPSLDKF